MEIKETDIPSTSVQMMTMSSDTESDRQNSGVGAVKVKMSAKKITKQKDCSVKKGLPSGQSRPSDHVRADSSSEDEHSSGGLQARILQELQKVNSRLDAVEDKVQEHSFRSTDQRDFSKLSTPKYSVHNDKRSRKSKKSKTSRYDSSSEDEVLPSLSVLKSSRNIQRQVDARIAEIESHSKLEGNDSKLKSKRGGGVDVLVSKKVA